jgi:hypothetical protein
VPPAAITSSLFLGVVDEPFETWGGTEMKELFGSFVLDDHAFVRGHVPKTSPSDRFDSFQFVLVREQRVGARFVATLARN